MRGWVCGGVVSRIRHRAICEMFHWVLEGASARVATCTTRGLWLLAACRMAFGQFSLVTKEPQTPRKRREYLLRCISDAFALVKSGRSGSVRSKGSTHWNAFRQAAGRELSRVENSPLAFARFAGSVPSKFHLARANLLESRLARGNLTQCRLARPGKCDSSRSALAKRFSDKTALAR